MILNNKFVYAYHRGRWVNVPIFYVPEGAIGDDGYLHHFQFILEDGQVLPEPKPRRCSDAAYERIAAAAKEIIWPEQLSKSELKDLCINNNIHLGWVTNKFSRSVPKGKTGRKSTRRTKRKCKALDTKSYNKFIKELNHIRKKSAVIARILWFLNGQLKNGDDFITIDEVLRLLITDVDPDDGIYTCISLSRPTPRGTHMVSHYLPKHIWKPLCQLIHPDCLYVFSNKNGGPILSQNVKRDFKIAGERVGLKVPVTSLSLRPGSKLNQLKIHSKYEKIQKLTDRQSKEVSAKEWETLRKKIPALESKLGRPPTHDPRAIFNGFLYHIRTKTPLRKLPSIYPPGKVIHSQYRRWKKNGVFDAVLSTRQ